MNRKIEFFYDVLSPYAYLAFCRLPGIVKRCRAELVLRPASLPRILERAENTPPATVPARFAYIQKDVATLSKYYGLPLEWPEVFPARTGRAMSVLTLLEGKSQMKMSRTLFQAYWVEGRDPGDPEVLAELVGTELLQRAAGPEVRAQLDATSDEAVERGAFGLPVCFVDEQMFFGNDRLFLAQVALNAFE